MQEMKNYGISLLGLSETRWLQSGLKKLFSGEVILYSGNEENSAPRTEDVAFVLSREAQEALIGWEPINSRIISATFNTRNKNIKLDVVQCYAPTNDADDGKKEEFYEQLQNLINKLKRKDITILMGDLNAKIGADNTGYEEIMGKQGLGQMNENGELFADVCAMNQLVIGGSVYPHERIHKATWRSPDHITENQIDHVCVSSRFKRSLQDVKVRRGADGASDHHPVLITLKLRLKRH